LKTYLVPIDFSPSAIHAAKFTAALSHQTDVDHIILLNAYYVSSIETILPNADMVQLTYEEIEDNAAERITNLELLRASLLDAVKPGVKITIHLNRSHLVRAVVDQVVAKNVDLVVLGSRGNTSEEETQIGSHVIVVAKACPVPLIIVPLAYEFKAIHKVVIACDFNNVKDNIPLENLKKVIADKDVELLVVNIDNKGIEDVQDPERLAEESALHTMLKAFKTTYFNLHKKDVINGILEFATDQKAQLVISLPHKYSFFRSLLHTSISNQLAQNAAVPVLLLK
jgi:nucleotide-binding universal stress UspA family protein